MNNIIAGTNQQAGSWLINYLSILLKCHPYILGRFYFEQLKMSQSINLEEGGVALAE